jgi:hypothetical protein
LNLSTGTQLVQYAVNWFTGREGRGRGNGEPAGTEASSSEA